MGTGAKFLLVASVVGIGAWLYLRSRRASAAPGAAPAGGVMVPDRSAAPPPVMPHAEADRLNRQSLAQGGPILVIPQRVPLPGTAPNFANMSATEIRAWVDANRAIASKWTTAEKSQLSKILACKSGTASACAAAGIAFT